MSCSACDGKGYLEYETGVIHEQYVEISKDICDVCWGSGVVEK